MDTALLVIVMSIVALHAAAIVGGGLGLLVMRLLGRGPTAASAPEGTDPTADVRPPRKRPAQRGS